MAESRIAIYGAMGANLAIAVTKFIAAGVTGSSSMMSEGIHSLVDTGNGALLLVGLKQSQKPASPAHPFGRGKELYFWSLIVGVLIFGLGGGVSFYEGVLHVREPAPLEDPTWNYVVLACAFVFESISLALAWRQFKTERGPGTLWHALRASKDPTTFTVLAEDSAALAGLVIAAIGVFASHAFDEPALDGVASMAIGVLLAGVAVLLIRESRGLLVGEGVSPALAREIRELATAEDSVHRAGPVLSMYVGPDDVLVTFDVHVRPELPSGDVAETVQRIQQRVKERCPAVTRLYIEVKSA
ncbi:cation diffusion facilitator family transporter [Ramlibacter sp. XY19]|uniref:cation diffusion facilitator family transporter n=1 Tax=Ramlibacter paludis TaxID=2908000 RepID=UPI0023DBCFB7|nr:cation diffusion facilitator family transporter [Ramlibacter paludis]